MDSVAPSRLGEIRWLSELSETEIDSTVEPGPGEASGTSETPLIEVRVLNRLLRWCTLRNRD